MTRLMLRPDRLAPLAVLVALTTAVLAALLTGTPDPTGISGPGLGSGTALAATRAILLVAAVGAVGCGTLPLLLRSGPIGRSAVPLVAGRQWMVLTGLVWAVAAAAGVILLARDVTGTIGAVPEVLDELAVGRALLLSGACGAVVAGLSAWSLRSGTRVPPELPLGVALIGLLPLPLTGHRSERWQDLSVFAVELHVLSVALWVGGLAAIVLFLLRDPVLPAVALPRFSRLASICIVVVAVSGAFTGVLTLVEAESFPGGLAGPYGLLLLVKVVVLLGIGLSAIPVRRRLLPAVTQGRAAGLALWCGGEVVLMAVAVGVAVVLTRTPAG